MSSRPAETLTDGAQYDDILRTFARALDHVADQWWDLPPDVRKATVRALGDAADDLAPALSAARVITARPDTHGDPR